MKTFLVLDQYREGSEYNDFIGKFYHFPKKYLKLLSQTNIEFIYYEPKRQGKGVYYGYGKIQGKPFEDKRESNFYFVEIKSYKPFHHPVPFEDGTGPREIEPYYNPQNAVRRIRQEVLEEICLDGGIQLNFTADAHLIKVLGEQLIASEKVGILELIKNAYDAQASYCRVQIEKVETLPTIDESLYDFHEFEGPVIVIEDDGVGMTKEVIENGWLRPASTLKTKVKERLKRERLRAIQSGTLGTYESLTKQLKKEYKNRIPLGEKGVGRFATHRLGKNLLIKTKVADIDYEYVLTINWEDFDNITDSPVDLDSIGVKLSRQKPSRNYGEKNSGTQIIISGGKEGFAWDQKTIEDLTKSVIRLNSPNPNPQKLKNLFQASLECPQIPDLPNFDFLEQVEPVFSFEGLVDENGILDYTLKFQPPPKSVPLPEEIITDKAFDLKLSKSEYWKNTSKKSFRTPECGAFYLHLDIWYRVSPWIDDLHGKELTDYLKTFGGISIYREGINIFPAEWGAETDWLGLKARHIMRGSKISYYNMIGNLEIDQTDNLDLIDKTDREGLIRNRAYNDLVELLQAIIRNVVEIPFIGKRDKYTELTKEIVRDPKTLKEYTTQNLNIVSNIQKKYPIKDDPFAILENLGTVDERKQRLINLERSIKNLQESLDLMNEQKELLTDMAGFGLAIAVSVHEISKITSNFYYGVNEILKKGKIDENKLKELKDASSSLQSELKRLSPLRAVRSEKRVEFDILKSINYAREVFKKKFQKLSIEFVINNEHNFQVYARYGAILQIFSNLFDNSCYWLETIETPERIIRLHIDSKYRTVTVTDNGPGIHESIRPYLFQAGYSLRNPPSGLGLYICKHYMQAMKGDIYLTNSRERLAKIPGAQFTLDFGKVPANKEGAKS